MDKEIEINQLRDDLTKILAKNIEKEKFDAKRDGWFKDLVHLCEKVGDHAINVSEAMTGEMERDLKQRTKE